LECGAFPPLFFFWFSTTLKPKKAAEKRHTPKKQKRRKSAALQKNKSGGKAPHSKESPATQPPEKLVTPNGHARQGEVASLRRLE